MPWGAAIAGIAGYLGNRERNKGADRAADAQERAADEAVAEQRRQFDLTRGDLMPWLDQGRDALGRQRAFLDGDWSGFMDAPDYKYAVEQGMQGLDRNAASRGSLFSGGTDLDRIGFGQGMALQNANGYWNKLAGLSNTGQVTGTSLGQFGQGTANSIGSLLTNAGNARASSYLERGANNADMWGGLGGLLNKTGQNQGWWGG